MLTHAWNKFKKKCTAHVHECGEMEVMGAPRAPIVRGPNVHLRTCVLNCTSTCMHAVSAVERIHCPSSFFPSFFPAPLPATHSTCNPSCPTIRTRRAVSSTRVIAARPLPSSPLLCFPPTTRRPFAIDRTPLAMPTTPVSTSPLSTSTASSREPPVPLSPPLSANTFRQNTPSRPGTFRKRPVSTTAALRRGSSFATRPPDDDAPAVRLRRGSTFLSPNHQHASSPINPPLRRTSARFSDAKQDVRLQDLPPAQRRFRAVASTSSLPRAGTFAYGSQTPVKTVEIPAPQVEAVRRASSTDKLTRAKCCGMCSSCMTGIAAMPPWAPERMKTMSEEEREEVLMQMEHNEAKGRLERELRRKRLSDMQAVTERLQKKRSNCEQLDSAQSTPENVNRRSVREKDELKTDTTSSSEFVAKQSKPSLDFELESIDLADERKTQRTHISDPGSSTEPLSACAGLIPKRAFRRRMDGCGHCETLERKVNDLEEQLQVLREVTQLCGENEQAEKLEEEQAKQGRGKGWMGKIASAYYGSAAAATERQRLKEEVEALRKATDFLFQKLQASEE